MKRKVISLTIRIPIDLKEKLAICADAEYRTLSKEIIRRLDESVGIGEFNLEEVLNNRHYGRDE